MIVQLDGTMQFGTAMFKQIEINTEQLLNTDKPGTTMEWALLSIANASFNNFDHIDAMYVNPSPSEPYIFTARNLKTDDVNELAVIADRMVAAIQSKIGDRKRDRFCENVITQLYLHGYPNKKAIDYLVKFGYHEWFAKMWVDAVISKKWDAVRLTFMSAQIFMYLGFLTIKRKEV